MRARLILSVSAYAFIFLLLVADSYAAGETTRVDVDSAGYRQIMVVSLK